MVVQTSLIFRSTSNLLNEIVLLIANPFDFCKICWKENDKNIMEMTSDVVQNWPKHQNNQKNVQN